MTFYDQSVRQLSNWVNGEHRERLGVSDAHLGTPMWTPATLRSARRPHRPCMREPAVCNLPDRRWMGGAHAAAA